MTVFPLRSKGPEDLSATRQSFTGLVLVSPLMILAVTWTLSLTIAVVLLQNPERYDLAHFFVGQHHLDLGSFSARAGARLALLAAVFVLGYAVAGLSLPTTRNDSREAFEPEKAVRILWWINLVFIGITFVWVLVTARQLGGISGMILLVRQDAYLAREILIENKLFTGMRLFYAALPATGCLAAVMFANRRQMPLSRKAAITCVTIVLVNLAILVVLPIVMSQRLILLQYVISVHVAVCMIRGRIVAAWLMPVATLLFLLTWVLHEAVTNPDINRSAMDIAAQKLGFYIINDLWNSFRPFDIDLPHTYGLFSFQFVMFFSLTDVQILDMMGERIAALQDARGGGEFSLFSAPYVDFGFLGAALYLFVIGGLVRYAFHRGRDQVLWAAIYGQVANALVLSVHVNFFGSQDFVFSILVMMLVMHWSGRHLVRQPDG
jgi:oligosaccharide repeat unit polymerase